LMQSSVQIKVNLMFKITKRSYASTAAHITQGPRKHEFVGHLRGNQER
jgi:hypothetical protein